MDTSPHHHLDVPNTTHCPCDLSTQTQHGCDLWLSTHVEVPLSAAGLAINSSVTSAALNAAVGSNVTAIDSSSGGALLLDFNRVTEAVDNNTVVLSGMPALQDACIPHFVLPPNTYGLNRSFAACAAL